MLGKQQEEIKRSCLDYLSVPMVTGALHRGCQPRSCTEPCEVPVGSAFHGWCMGSTNLLATTTLEAAHFTGSPCRHRRLLSLQPLAGWFGADAGDTIGVSCPALPCWSTNMCLNQQKKVLSKHIGGFKSGFLHPVRHLLTFCITYKLHSCPLCMRRCIFQPQNHWGLVEPLFSLLDGRALASFQGYFWIPF